MGEGEREGGELLTWTQLDSLSPFLQQLPALFWASKGCAKAAVELG